MFLYPRQMFVSFTIFQLMLAYGKLPLSLSSFLQRCCDGGFTSNIPLSSDPDVISVSPFSGDCDICPQGESASPHIVNISDQPLQISAKNIVRLTNALCPTSWNQLEELFHQGYSDGLRFFRRKGVCVCVCEVITIMLINM